MIKDSSFAAGALAVAFSAFAAQAAVFDVRDFGAKGDGVAKDTAAVQRTIDAANAAGGGEVLLQKGIYLCGSIFLKSGVDFHLAEGAVLKGSPDREDYNDVGVAPQNWGRLGAGDNISGGHLILCIEQENVTLRGPGKVDGNVGAFLRMPDGSHPENKLKIPWRPAQMVWFVESRNIAIRDVELADAPYWSCFVYGCEDVVVERANIHTVRKPHTYNGDGLDIDSSRRVRVTGCNISTADDSITLRASGQNYLKKDGPCADVTVTDCTLSSDCNAIRLGVGNGTIRDSSFRNIKIANTRYAVNAVGAWSRPEHGVDISNISFENMEIDAKGFCKFYYKFATDGVFDGISFRRVRGKVREPSIFDDKPERPFRNLRFDDVRLEGETSPRIAKRGSTAPSLFVEDDPVRWVDPFVGTSATGHTFPAACVPFGLVQAGPDTGNGTWHYCGGYRYEDKTICGFTQTHLNGTGCPDLGDVRILPFTNSTRSTCSTRLNINPVKKLSEIAEPGYYAVTLGDGIKVEIAAAEHSAIYRISANGKLRLLVDCAYGIGGKNYAKTITASVVKLVGKSGLFGKNHRRQWVERDYSFIVKFSREFTAVEELPRQKGVVASQYVFDFDASESPLLIKVALSAEGGVEVARRNLVAEIPAWDFDRVKGAARAKWNNVLSRTTIDGSDDQKKNWYTSLYHLFIQPNNIADVGTKPFYSTFSTWDTFRAAHPLYTIIAPEKAAEFVDSMLEQGRRTGYLPIWTLWGKDNQCMIGTHSVPVIVDLFLKEANDTNRNCHNCSQITNTNVAAATVSLGVLEKPASPQNLQNSKTPSSESNLADSTCSTRSTRLKNGRLKYWLEAYAQIKDTLTKPHKGRIKERWDLLDKYGYYPFDEIKGESVSRTMECAYDDWCAARMAQKLGERGTGNGELDKRLKADAEFFFKRSENWRNVFDSSIGFVRGRDSNGNWREPYNPYALGHGADKANDFTEGNAFQYTWHVMQNPQGLVDAMGGRDAFVKKLDSLFLAPSKTEGMGEVLDVTGLIGQYVHGNEPSHHVIYFYPQVGHPEKAAERIREVFDKFYLPKPDGLCGNDDCGQMSAWYIFSAMGFYPFNPCGGEYVLGAPQVPEARIRLGERGMGNGKGEFCIFARNLSRENKYVKSVTLNDKPLTDWKIHHSDIMVGGELVFEMYSGKAEK